MLLRVLLTILPLLFVSAVPAKAQDSFVLVIDGSSSMWGQVGGETKMAILKRSLAEVLGQLDTDADVGVVAFGHREKGNCSDIEQLVSPQPFDAVVIQAAIDNIQPKGKTPLSDAVRLAAEELRFTEERATVVILGDGGENCNKDPCAVAEELEKTGVDLTVHAIAFDIADAEGSGQLQCFASATGGLFLPVADAPELLVALETVQKEVESPEPVAVTFEAVDQATGEPLDGSADWSILDAGSGAPQATGQTAAAFAAQLVPGNYRAQVAVAEVNGEATFVVGPGQPTRIVVAVALSQPVRVQLEPTDSETGNDVDRPLDWVITKAAGGQVQTFDDIAGPLEIALMPGNYIADVRAEGVDAHVSFAVGQGLPMQIGIAIVVRQVRLTASDAATGQPVSGPILWSFIETTSGATVQLDAVGGTVSSLVPAGDYDVVAKTATAAGSARVTVGASGITDVVLDLYPPTATVRLTAIDAATGALISGTSIAWTFVDIGTEETVEISAVPNGGVTEQVPPGAYDVIVEAGDGYGEAQVTVMTGNTTDIVVEVVIPEAPFVVAGSSFPAGSAVAVRWNFDGRPSDLVFILSASDRDNHYPLGDQRRHVVGTTRAATLTAPAVPGEYEVRYFSLDAGGLVHRAPLWVLSAEGGISGPGQASTGETVDVTWTGPGRPGDFLFVAPPAWDDDVFPMRDSEHVPVTGDGKARLTVPEREGQYEYRYYSAEGGGVLFRAPVLVTPPGASITAPERAEAGSAFTVEFNGPRDNEDRLFIATAGSDPERYPLASEAKEVVQRGGPATLVAPVNPGAYEVRYFSRDKGGMLATAPITVTAAVVEIDAPRLIQRASDLQILVKGPMAPGDIVFIAPEDWKDNAYPFGKDNQLSYGAGGHAVAAKGGFRSFETVSPALAGAYEIRYFSWANGTVLHRRALVVK